MVCDECKNCSNYLVCEIGCFGNDEPCDFLETDNQDLAETLGSIKKDMY